MSSAIDRCKKELMKEFYNYFINVFLFLSTTTGYKHLLTILKRYMTSLHEQTKLIYSNTEFDLRRILEEAHVCLEQQAMSTMHLSQSSLYGYILSYHIVTYRTRALQMKVRTKLN